MERYNITQDIRKFNLGDSENESEMEEKKDYFQWRKIDNNTIIPEGQITLIKPPIKPGLYEIGLSNKIGYFLSPKNVSIDELFPLPNDMQENILGDIKKFWTRKKQFEKYGYTYKRGIMLTGAAGGGKTSLINLLSKEIIEQHEGVVFQLFNADQLQMFINFIPKFFKVIQPDTPILCTLEDLETFTSYKETETALLNFLDGINQINNIVIIGTTNYPEKLQDRLLNRPSRFDRRYEIKMPDEKIRQFYFEKKLKEEDLKEIDLEKWVNETEGYSLAHLGEIIKSVYVLGNTFEETMDILSGMKKKISSHDFNKSTTQLGFRK